MILDGNLVFDPAATAITVTAASTNIIDLHGSGMIPAAAAGVGRDMGIGSSSGATPKLMVVVQQTFTAAGAATLNVQVQGAPDNGSGSPGSYVTYAETGAIAKGSLVVGNRIFDIDLPRVLVTPVTPANVPRFIRLNYVVATGPMTAGTVYAALILGRDDQMTYQSGFTVSN